MISTKQNWVCRECFQIKHDLQHPFGTIPTTFSSSLFHLKCLKSIDAPKQLQLSLLICEDLAIDNFCLFIKAATKMTKNDSFLINGKSQFSEFFRKRFPKNLKTKKIQKSKQKNQIICQNLHKTRLSESRYVPFLLLLLNCSRSIIIILEIKLFNVFFFQIVNKHCNLTRAVCYHIRLLYGKVEYPSISHL